MPTLLPALLLTAFLLLVTPPQVAHTPGASALDATAYLLLAGSGLALALRLWQPLFGYAASLACVCAYLLLGHPPGPVFLAPLVTLIFLVGQARLRVWIPGAISGALALAAVHLSTGAAPLTTAVWMGVWLGLAGLAAAGLKVRGRLLAESRARVEWARRSEVEESRRRLAEERLGIAREMHDVVGHSLAVISLQAGVAEHLLHSRPEEAQKAIAAIRQVSRQALGELRAELAVLRGEERAERTPPPDLGRARQLVDSMREAGLAVDLRSELDGQAIPEVVGAAAFRIIQESLTNVVRHAGPQAHAIVALKRVGDAVEVEVTDDGAGAQDQSPGGAGLRGMRERAAALGGHLVAENLADGGFRVRATLPWGAR